MILKRFENNNEHLDYKNKIINESISEQTDVLETKLDLLANISKNWNDELKENYYSVKSLYKLNLEELKEIRSKYIIKETLTDNTTIDSLFESQTEDNTLLLDAVAELTTKYGGHDAVQNIRIDEGKIIFDLLCDTDIEQSVIEYNGFTLTYNKVCEVPINESLTTKVDDIDDIDENAILNQSIMMTKLFRDF